MKVAYFDPLGVRGVGEVVTFLVDPSPEPGFICETFAVVQTIDGHFTRVELANLVVLDSRADSLRRQQLAGVPA